MALPKDDFGFFVINKSEIQLDEDKEIERILKRGHADIYKSQIESVFLKLEPNVIDYLYDLISSSRSFKDKYITLIKSSDGLFFLTRSSSQLQILLSSLAKDE